MAVARDSQSESHTGTTWNTSSTSFSWTHTPVGTPRAIVVFTFVNANADDATGVTYWGVSMTAVPWGRALDTLNEPWDCKARFLGSSIPTWAQTIVVSRNNNTNVMYAACHAFTAWADTEPYGVVLLQQNQILSEQNVDDGSPWTNSVRVAGIMSGNSSQGIWWANSTLSVGSCIDYGVRVCCTVYETTPWQGSRPVGFSYGTSDDVAAVHFAVREYVAPTTYAGNFMMMWVWI